MSSSDLVVAVLLGVGVAAAALSVVGTMLTRDTQDRVHFLAPVSSISPLVIAVAVVVREVFNSRGLKALLVFVLVAALNPVLMHAIARSAYRSEAG